MKDMYQRPPQQIRKSAYSVPMNIAGGNAKRTGKDKRHFLDISMGSLEELHCQVRMVCDLHYIRLDQFAEVDQQINRVSFLLVRFRSSIQV